jgi:hypothetical protein
MCSRWGVLEGALLFSLEETTTWTSDDALARLKQTLPASWELKHSVEQGWYRATIQNEEGEQQWAGEHPDPKILFLDALGWLRLRNHQTKNPAWRRRRERGVVLVRPGTQDVVPDPPDLDPDEVGVVYRSR